MFTSPLCHRDDSLLTLIDIQPRLAAAMAPESRERVVRNGAVLARTAQLLGVPQLITEQYPKGLGHTAPELSEALETVPPVVEKSCFSCHACGEYRTALNESRRRQVILAGMESHVCVLQTALELHHDGYQVFVVEDAVCSRAEGSHRNALERLRQAGVVVTNTESVLFEWLRNAKDPHFKAVSALIK